VLNGWTFDEVLDSYAVSKAELTHAFARLARAQLIDWGPGERVRLKIEREFEWRAGGPVKKAYGNRVMQELLKGRFDGPAELLRFEARDVSEESAAVMRRRLERLAAEFNELAEIDASLPAAPAQGLRRAARLPAVGVLGDDRAEKAQELGGRKPLESLVRPVELAARGLSILPRRRVRLAGRGRAHVITASTAAASPCSTASTFPSRRLRTQPRTPWRSACAHIASR
jgi:hypothetical protein